MVIKTAMLAQANITRVASFSIVSRIFCAGSMRARVSAPIKTASAMAVQVINRRLEARAISC